MNGEEKRIGGKKRSKEADVGIVSDDDEPIGSLFKLKNKKNSRKGKLGLDGGTGKKVQVKTEGSVAAKEDDGSMEDTLASFRKKLKAPKKDKGVGTVMKKGLGFDEVELLCGSEMVNDDGLAPKEMPTITEEGGHIHSDVNTNTKKQQRMKLDGRRVKKPKYDCLEATHKLEESNPDADLDKTHGVASLVQVPQCPSNTLRSSCDSMKEEASHDGFANPNRDIMEKSDSLLIENKHEPCPEEAKCSSDGPTKSNSLPAAQRGSRKAKKHRHGDMAYDDEVDWEILLRAQGLLNRSGRDVHCDQPIQMRKKLGSSSGLASDFEIEGTAAVSAGLKADAVSPIEKIKFKEVLKRKGGVLEYLECRNKILSLWSKDVSRVLSLTDCGVPYTPAEDESSYSSLTRNVYLFLDQSGYINVGIASKKDKAESSSTHKYKLLGAKKFEGHSGSSATDSADGVSFILGQVKNPHNLTKSEDGVADRWGVIR